MKVSPVAVAFAVLVAALVAPSVEAIFTKGEVYGTTKQCEGYFDIAVLDVDCSTCISSVRSFRAGRVQCETNELAKACCKTVSSSW
ncbi:hypothetical protein GQ42DRAFT_162721 [Ramicandelaber brevisporus]|nr:hypothetical protein GQ42DRAFT_162721 [Ramicandelaber brevisporus]